jgi:hypothetical protein
MLADVENILKDFTPTALIQKQLNAFGKETVALLKKYHIEAGQKATGNALKEFDYVVDIEGDNVVLTVLGTDYTEYLDRGRGWGKMSPVDSILEWMKVKGVARTETEAKQRGIAFAISYVHSLYGSVQHQTGKTKNGFEKPISKAVNDARINELKEILQNNFVVGIERSVLEKFGTFNYD